jgi:hypothetical protein
MTRCNMPRKPGGQPGNRNAFKHGFYSKYFNAFESRALSKIPLTDMAGEIGLLRVNVDRFMQAYTASLEELDFENRLAGLRAITLAVGRIAALQRILSSSAKYTDKYTAETDQIQNLWDSIAEVDQPDESQAAHTPE